MKAIMPANKNAVIRYKYLDELLSDKHHYYDIHELTAKCNARLERDGYLPVCQRSVEKDLTSLEYASFRAELERFAYEGKCIIRYKEPGYSIFTKKLTEDEIALLREVLDTVGQFDGLDNFTWLDGLKAMLGAGSRPPVISFASVRLKDSNLLGRLFTAISARQVIDLSYHRFEETQKHVKVHPYLLKQYNGRWFLICAADSDGFILTFALDRIDGFEPCPANTYRECTEDLQVRFEHIVGVTYNNGSPVEDIVLWASPNGLPYLTSKPIHPSLTEVDAEEDTRLRREYPHLQGGSFLRMRCMVNVELTQAVMAYADELVVLSPSSLKKDIQQKILRLKANYLL